MPADGDLRVAMTTVHDFRAVALGGNETSLANFAGRVLLIVNTASKCGFTPQYEGLEKLYRCHIAEGLTVLGFPCNQFGGQEPGNSEEIGAFCATAYSVTFPIFEKIEVNGANAHPLYKYLTRARRGLFGTPSIKWNFTKFLVDRTGRVIARYSPRVKPSALEDAIQRLLKIT
jgi:glutathione peroxidase